MKRSVWIGAAALCLGGWLAGLHGQEPVWRPTRPGAGDRASLGRPVPLVRGARPDSEPVPPVLHQTIYHSAQPIATVPSPGAIIATSARTQPPPAVLPAPPVTIREEPDPDQGDLFASDRDPGRVGEVRNGPVTLVPRWSAPDVKSAGNWKAPPVPLGVPPPPA